MTDISGSSAQKHPNLNLSPEERRLFGQVFSAADSENIGVVTGDVALRFFPERTKLPAEILGEIWQIADTEDKGFLTPAGFGIILRLIGYAQAGRPVSAELALKPGGPLPEFEGINAPSGASEHLQAQLSGGPVRVPPLLPEKAKQYASLFDDSGAQNGLLPGATAKQIFDRAQLPNDVLVRIWNLADTEQRGKLSVTEFIIAMHLLASHRSGAMRLLPQALPPGLLEAAARKGAPPRQVSGSRRISDSGSASGIQRPVSGIAPPRGSSSVARAPYGGPVVASHSPQAPGGWDISPTEKAQFDGLFAKLDGANNGFVTGDQAVGFFSNSKLPEDDLAQIWDLADINSSGQLSRDEFAVAMYLIKGQLSQRSPLPQSLPPGLVPPGMRTSTRAAQLPVPPLPQSASPSPAKPQSAVDDLFGLDALTTPSQVASSTGDSPALKPTPSPQTSSPASYAAAPSTIFKPFVPSSSFGQQIQTVTPQTTGLSRSSTPLASNSSPQPHANDLLGDTDPEISRTLTTETTELANLSNQVGTLTTQMHQVKVKRASTEQDLTQVNAQKRDFESRLSQLRAAYEQEVRDVKALEVRLAAARAETSKIQQDLVMVQHSQQNLAEQHQQVTQALEADRNENASLKERMQQVNVEMNQLKPVVEKLRSEARQQKGLVAINKKQLSTNELERDKVKTEHEAASKELQDSAQELEESQQALEESQRALEASQTATPAGRVVSPAASTTSQSMNPFFRRTSTTASESGIASAPPARSATVPNHSAFDSFFGPSVVPSNPGPSTGAPSISFGTPRVDQPRHQLGENQVSKGFRDQSSAPSATVETNDTFPPPSEIPPPPPQSRQITSSSLPLQDHLPRAGSITSSVGVAVPSSRFGDDASKTATPTRSQPFPQPSASTLHFGQSDTTDLSHGTAAEPGVASAPQPEGRREPRATSISPDVGKANDLIDDFGQPSAQREIPGAFPEPTPFQTPLNTGGLPIMDSVALAEGYQHDLSDPFASTPKPSRDAAVNNFDSAFEGFVDKGKGTANDADPSTHTTSAVTQGREFPPIHEFEDVDSDSDSEPGFDDNFTTASPKGKQTAIEPNLAPMLRPDLERNTSSQSELPTPNAQASPPTYDQAVPSLDGEHREANQFPAEYGGLLPARVVSVSEKAGSLSPAPGETNGNLRSTTISSTPIKDDPRSGAALPTSYLPMPPGSTAAPFAYHNSTAEEGHSATHDAPPAVPPKDDFDDFDQAFGDLSEAQPADVTATEDDIFAPREAFDNFTPTFDAPTPSKQAKSPTSASTADAFRDFETTVASPVQASSSKPQPAPANHDWDAMFAGLDSNPPLQTNGKSATPARPPNAEDLFGGFDQELSAPPGTKPTLMRGMSEGTEHDDPILKRLTGMGYPRNESLRALEKFDYNLDKAADFLTSKS